MRFVDFPFLSAVCGYCINHSRIIFRSLVLEIALVITDWDERPTQLIIAF